MGLLDTVQHHVGDHMGYSAAIKEVMVRAKSKIVKTDSRGREQHKDLIEYQKTRRRISQPKSQADAEAKAKLAEQQIMPREEDSFIASQDDVDEEFMAKDQQRRQERTRPLPDTESHKPPTEKAPRKPKKALTLGLTRVRRDGEELLSKSIDIDKDSTNQRIRKKVSDVVDGVTLVVWSHQVFFQGGLGFLGMGVAASYAPCLPPRVKSVLGGIFPHPPPGSAAP